MSTAALLDTIAKESDRHLAELIQWLEIPSISSDSARTADVQLAADEDGFGSHVGNGLFRRVRLSPTEIQLENYLAIDGDTDGDESDR